MASTPQAKEIHRRAMLATGWMMAAMGAWAGYLALGGAGRFPALMYGRLAAPKPPEQAPVLLRRAGKSLVRWRAWDDQVLASARRGDRLILLHLETSWSRQCRLMEQTTYADAGVAALIESRFVPIRVDADARPDLARRYLGAGWPTTALLLPTGEILDRATFMPAPIFLNWAKTLDDAFVRRRDSIKMVVKKASERRRAEPVKREGARVAPANLETQARKELEDFAESDGPRFPEFREIRLLQGVDRRWALELAHRKALEALALEDKVWGGFYRYAGGPGWNNPEREKRLEDQAQAVAALTSYDVEAARRALEYVGKFLEDPRGGYYSSQASEVERPGGWVAPGALYFNLNDRKRRALGIPAVDRRLFAAGNAAMIAVRPESGAALKALERWWREGIKEGLTCHELGGPATGWLDDQAAFVNAFLAAYQATGEVKHLERARVVLEATLRTLSAGKGGGFYDRPATGQLAPELDRIAFPELNFELWLALRRFAGFPSQERQLRRWLMDRASALGAAERAVMAMAP